MVQGAASPASRPLGRLLTAAGWAVPAVLFACLARLTWRAWAHPYIDFGREAYTPWRLSSGDVLYRDIAWFNGPLSAYWHALLFKVFGASLGTLFVANMLTAVAVGLLLHRLLTRASGPFGAWLGLTTFVLVFAFAHVGSPNFNWIAPYSHEATHGVALSLLALLLLERLLNRPEPSQALGRVTGATIALVFLTKVEVALALFGGVSALTMSHRGRLVPHLGALAAGALAVLAVSITAFALSAGPEWALAHLIDPWRFASIAEIRGLPFYRVGLGLEAPRWHLAVAGIGFVGFGGLATLAVGVDVLTRRRRVLNLLSAFVLLILTLALLLALLVRPSMFLRVLQPLPLLLIAAMVWLFVTDSASDASGARFSRPAAAAAAGFSFALLFKMLLNARVHHYGFVLAMPGTVAILALLSGNGVHALKRRLGASGMSLRALSLAAAAFLSFSALTASGARYGEKRWTMGRGPDRIRTDESGLLIDAALARVDGLGARTMVVLPEGVMLNFLALIPNPTPYVSFMPPELIMFGEDRMAEALERAPPDVVVLLHRDTSAYGVPFFGRDFGFELYAWVLRNYRLDMRFGQEPFRSPAGFGIDVMVPISNAQAGTSP